MTVERVAQIVLWVVFPLLLYKVTPRYRIREVVAVFLFFQMLTWLFSIGLTYFDLLSAPVREFQEATKINFTFEYIVFPTFAVLFQLWYPENSGKVRQVFHYVYSVGAILLFMFVLGKTTELMTVKPDHLYRSALNFSLELLVSRRYIGWLKKEKPFSYHSRKRDVYGH
ncbi:hypothetical protein PY093_06520 [Cytobacillus sp. S13-E01]|uniref:CBO0543 family protein n=1 Tax=Cytobacillus sp. S13-E01 TaxID=3031326 RepID=UPI0023D83E23|nr:CBO0543 family protein [Cytobacillus sp. S13-E01]MDF0726369.1 hypothetical protein [Cytobacillus sp. S13-E01]